MRSPALTQALAPRDRRIRSTGWCWDTPSNPLRSSTTTLRRRGPGARSVSTCRWPGQDIGPRTFGSTRKPRPWTCSATPSSRSRTQSADQASIMPPTLPAPPAFPSPSTLWMLLAGTTFTELDQVASFWFALTDTWRGGAPPHLRPHTCSGQLCELPPVTAPASTGPADLPSLLARTRKAVILTSAGQRRPALAFPERPRHAVASSVDLNTPVVERPRRRPFPDWTGRS